MYLVLYNGNYADEFDFQAWEISETNPMPHYRQLVEQYDIGDNIIWIHIGTNKEVVELVAELLDSIEVTEITPEQVMTLGLVEPLATIPFESIDAMVEELLDGQDAEKFYKWKFANEELVAKRFEFHTTTKKQLWEIQTEMAAILDNIIVGNYSKSDSEQLDNRYMELDAQWLEVKSGFLAFDKQHGIPLNRHGEPYPYN